MVDLVALIIIDKDYDRYRVTYIRFDLITIHCDAAMKVNFNY